MVDDLTCLPDDLDLDIEERLGAGDTVESDPIEGQVAISADCPNSSARRFAVET